MRGQALTTLAAVFLSVALGAGAAPGRLTVRLDQPGVKISPTFNGLMIEDINHSIDGGLYAELIQNRAFKDDANKPAHWSLVQDGGGVGTITLDKDNPVPGTALTTCLRLNSTTAGAGQRVGVANEGYWGIPVRPNAVYRASLYAKAAPGFSGPLTVAIESADGAATLARAQIPQIGTDWKQYVVTLKAGAGAASQANRFVVSVGNPGTVWLSQMSLMPPTYNNRPNGSRRDLMQIMGAMNPTFLRMPGGNYLEGNTIAERFDWKKTIGDIAQRPGHPDPWGYRSSDGYGLLEYLEWCEDLHMKPLLAVFAGYALGGEHIAAGPGLTPFVQDALDEIEYVTGNADTHWGAVRARDGHPAPFPLTYVEIGNEDWFDKSGTYDGRFAQFSDAIKAKYPNLQLIATMNIKSLKPDVVDDHYYRTARDMENDVHHYDGYDRSGPKIFVGEWASTEGNPTPNFQAALGDAAWLTGLERNSDLVVLESYAPLLVNVNPGARQWGTNLIGFDALGSFGSPSYYVQTMFGGNRGDQTVPADITPPTDAAAAVAPLPQGKIGVATWLTQAEFKDIQVTQGTKTLYATNFAAGAADWTFTGGQWSAQDGVLRQSSEAENCRATVGDPAWTDYTYHLQARKLSGKEGFLISFHVQDEANRVWWNIGGWGNTRTAIERFQDGSHAEIGTTPLTVETGRWYDIRIEVQGRRIRCFLDGKLITDATDVMPPAHSDLFATASRVQAIGEVILKVVNTASTPQTLQVELQGARTVAKTATALVLTGQPGDVNSLEDPEKVAPKSQTLTGVSRAFVHEFPAYSVSVIRLKAR